MAISHAKILREAGNYYSAKFREHGEGPLGVDWNSEESQFLRFQQLLRIVKVDSDFSIADIGCGYGVLVDYLKENFKKYEYYGFDVSEEMIAAAKARYRGDDSVRFDVSGKSLKVVDYCIASGIFNVRFKHSEDEWWDYITDTLDQLHESSSKGFSFNCLTEYSDLEKMLDRLYYASPCKVFDWCKKRYSKQVALLHDYELYEFTILVRK